ncbi:hypothetical protein [Halobellus sp. EA9]|uniref:hypothetical protein n=1 Tax=Halobellus sp. EA9 TaxID=3421647 RepID=UPI003EB9A8D2
MSSLHPRLAVVLAALVVLGGLPAVAVAQQPGSGPGSDGSFGGVVLVTVLGALPVVGGLVDLVVLLLGLGAFVAAVRGSSLDTEGGGGGDAVATDTAPAE